MISVESPKVSAFTPTPLSSVSQTLHSGVFMPAADGGRR